MASICHLPSQCKSILLPTHCPYPSPPDEQSSLYHPHNAWVSSWYIPPSLRPPLRPRIVNGITYFENVKMTVVVMLSRAFVIRVFPVVVVDRGENFVTPRDRRWIFGAWRLIAVTMFPTRNPAKTFGNKWRSTYWHCTPTEIRSATKPYFSDYKGLCHPTEIQVLSWDRTSTGRKLRVLCLELWMKSRRKVELLIS